MYAHKNAVKREAPHDALRESQLTGVTAAGNRLGGEIDAKRDGMLQAIPILYFFLKSRLTSSSSKKMILSWLF